MSQYLLDSDAIVDYLKGFAPTVELLRRLDRQGDRFCTCDVVMAEVAAGLDPAERVRGHDLLTSLRYLDTSAAAAWQAGIWRYDFARLGRQLSTTDCLIAAVAAEHQATLLTGNTADYPMPGLSLLPLPRAGQPSQ